MALAMEPKRPISAYAEFLAEHRVRIRLDLPACSRITDVVRVAGEQWRALEAGARAPYEKKYRDKLDTYRSELEKYQESGGQLRRRTRKPKEPKIKAKRRTKRGPTKKDRELAVVQVSAETSANVGNEVKAGSTAICGAGAETEGPQHEARALLPEAVASLPSLLEGPCVLATRISDDSCATELDSNASQAYYDPDLEPCLSLMAAIRASGSGAASVALEAPLTLLDTEHAYSCDEQMKHAWNTAGGPENESCPSGVRAETQMEQVQAVLFGGA